MRAVVTTSEPIGKLAAVIEETEARCPVMNLLLDAKVDLRMEWLRDSGKPADYADIVIVAQLHSYLGTPEMENLPHIDATPAYRKLGLGEFDPQTGLAVLRAANNVSSAIRELLQ